jgi:hypothetical protein
LKRPTLQKQLIFPYLGTQLISSRVAEAKSSNLFSPLTILNHFNMADIKPDDSVKPVLSTDELEELKQLRQEKAAWAKNLVGSSPRHEEYQYLDLIRNILENGEHRPDRLDTTLCNRTNISTNIAKQNWHRDILLICSPKPSLVIVPKVQR